MTPAVRVRGLTRRFGHALVLDRLDLDLEQGERVALLGRSGSGKTTLLRTLAGLDPAPSDAEIVLPHPVSVVFQEPRLLPWKSVWRNVALGLQGPNPRARAEAALAEVGLISHLNAWPATLSGGEAQRAALARALVRAPRLLLLDEPFAALDALTRINMHALLAELWRAHAPTTLIVTHDVDEAIQLADRCVVLEGGRLVCNVAVDLPHPRRHGHPRFVELRRLLLRQLGVDLD